MQVRSATAITCNSLPMLAGRRSRDAKISTLNKGERSDCNSYRDIFTIGKMFAHVILVRIQQLAERVYPESFRSGRSTIDIIFQSVSSTKMQRAKYVILHFIDLAKAFDLLSKDGLFKILTKVGCPPKMKNLIESFHNNMWVTVRYDNFYKS